MSDPNIKLSFSIESTTEVGTRDWLTIEQVDPPSEVASVSDAADILDAAFGINPCDPSATYDFTSEPSIEETEFWDVVEDKYKDNTGACLIEEDGSYAVYIKIYKSDQDENYVLRLDNGEILSNETTVVEETKKYNIPLEKDDEHYLIYPVLDNFQYQWLSGVANLSIEGNNLSFDQKVTGLLEVEFDTRHDLVKITVPCDENGDPEEATLLAFYKEMVFDLRIETPQIDPNQSVYCGGNYSSRFVVDEDEDICRKRVRYYDLCKCRDLTTRVANVRYEEVEAPCSRINEIPDRVFGDYVDCGQVTGDMNTPEFYLQECCELPEVAIPGKTLPDCRWEYRRLKPEKEPEDKDYYESVYGHIAPVVFQPKGPPGGICGKWTIEQQLYPNDCCGPSLPDLVWIQTYDNLQLNQSYIFIVAGGTSRKQWTTAYDAGVGIIPSADTNSARITINECFCNPVQITVSDECGNQITHDITNEAGSWVPYSTIVKMPLGQGGVTGGNVGGYYPGIWVTANNDEYKTRQVWARSTGYTIGGPTNQAAAIAAACNSCNTGYVCQDPPGAWPDDRLADGWVKCPDSNVIYRSPAQAPYDSNWVEWMTPGSFGNIVPGTTDNQQTWRWECPAKPDPLVYDDENSADTIGINSSAWVSVQDGKGPFTWSISGQGFWLDGNHYNTSVITTSLSTIKVYTQNACGTGTITVTDSCGDTVTGTINSTDGVWSSECNFVRAYQTTDDGVGWGSDGHSTYPLGKCNIQQFDTIAGPCTDLGNNRHIVVYDWYYWNQVSESWSKHSGAQNYGHTCDDTWTSALAAINTYISGDNTQPTPSSATGCDANPCTWGCP